VRWVNIGPVVPEVRMKRFLKVGPHIDQTFSSVVGSIVAELARTGTPQGTNVRNVSRDVNCFRNLLLRCLIQWALAMRDPPRAHPVAIQAAILSSGRSYHDSIQGGAAEPKAVLSDPVPAITVASSPRVSTSAGVATRMA